MAIAVPAVLVAVGTAQVSDFLTFVRMVALEGRFAEANPIVGQVAVDLGLPGLAIAKLALVGVVVSTFTIVARSSHTVAAVLATAGTFAGLLGAASNLLATR